MRNLVGAAVSFEWTKVRTLRPMLWSLALYVVVSLALALVTGVVVHREYADRPAPSTFDPISAGFSGLRLGLIALVVFGVLIVTTEYSSGSIRSSLAAVPRRGVFYTAKLLTGGLTAFVVSVVAVVTSFFATQATMGGAQRVSLSDASVLPTLAGAALYPAMLCLFSMGLATVLRSAALTMGILVPLFFTISTILTNLPGVGKVAQFLPDVAGGLVLYRRPPEGSLLDAGSGMAVLASWTAVSAIAGYLAFRRRDA